MRRGRPLPVARRRRSCVDDRSRAGYSVGRRLRRGRPPGSAAHLCHKPPRRPPSLTQKKADGATVRCKWGAANRCGAEEFSLPEIHRDEDARVVALDEQRDRLAGLARPGSSSSLDALHRRVVDRDDDVARADARAFGRAGDILHDQAVVEIGLRFSSAVSGRTATPSLPLRQRFLVGCAAATVLSFERADASRSAPCVPPLRQTSSVTFVPGLQR